MKPLKSTIALLIVLSSHTLSLATTLEVLDESHNILIPNGATADKFAYTDFPQTQVGQEDSSVVFMASDDGNLATITSIVLSGANPGDFALDPPDDLVLGAEESAALGISFVPTTAGTRNAIVTINYNAPGAKSHTFQLRGFAYVNFAVASADLKVALVESSHKFKTKTQTATYKAKVTIENPGKLPLEGGILRVFRASDRYFDNTATEVLSIPLKPMKASEVGKPVPRKKYKLKIDAGNSFGETYYIRVYPLQPTAIDDFWPDNQGSGGFAVI